MAKPTGNQIFFVLLAVWIAGCQQLGEEALPPVLPGSASLPAAGEPGAGSDGSTFNVIFDENQTCIVDGPDSLPLGKYTFRLDDRSGLNVDLNVVHLIDGRGYQDLLDLQDNPGEPFIKQYWMSLPFYFTVDHVVWTYTLDEPGEHVILILQHVFEGSWICDPFLVID